MHKYNVVFITVSSWNRNFVGCYNDNYASNSITPNLDELSKRCITFTSAFSPSVKTSASVLSIISGCYPCKYGDWFVSISEKRTIVSEILSKNGYSTYGFTSNPCTSSLNKYNKGYDIFRDDTIIKNISGRKLNVLLAIKTLFKNPYSEANKINSQILSLPRNSRSPYFMWIHYMDIHGPYISRNGWQFKNRISASRLWKKAIDSPEKISKKQRKKLKNIYQEKIRFLDFHIGELISQLDDRNTIIIISGDHGEVFGERGYFGHPFIFYNEMINVPLFIKLPSEKNTSNKQCKHPVSVMDLIPTIVDLLGLEVEIEFDGHSLVPLLEGRKDDYQAQHIISEISREYACVIKGKWKLIANYRKSSLELYNLENDFEEKNNIVKERLDIAQDLEIIIKKHFKKNRNL